MIGSMALTGTAAFAPAPMVIPGTAMAKELQSMVHTFDPANNPAEQASYCHQMIGAINGLLANPNLTNLEKSNHVHPLIKQWTLKAATHGERPVAESRIGNIKAKFYDTIGLLGETEAGHGVAGLTGGLGIFLAGMGALFLHQAATGGDGKILRGIIGTFGVAAVSFGIFSVHGGFELSSTLPTVDELAQIKQQTEVHPPLSAELCDVEPSKP